MTFDDFLELVATARGESSVHKKDVSASDLSAEALALAYSVMNYKYKRNHDQSGGYSPANVKHICTDMKAFASGNSPYKTFMKDFNTDPESFNNTNMQNYIKASIWAHARDLSKANKLKLPSPLLGFLALILIDHTFGAILWDGEDLKTNKFHPKIAEGYLVADKKHNVMGINSKKLTPPVSVTTYSKTDGRERKEVHSYEYKYITTCGFGISTFVKLHPDFEKATRRSFWTIKDGSYILGKWW